MLRYPFNSVGERRTEKKKKKREKRETRRGKTEVWKWGGTRDVDGKKRSDFG